MRILSRLLSTTWISATRTRLQHLPHHFQDVLSSFPVTRDLLPNIHSTQIWIDWYIFEHLPSIINSETCVRPALYEDIDLPETNTPSFEREVLAMQYSIFETHACL